MLELLKGVSAVTYKDLLFRRIHKYPPAASGGSPTAADLPYVWQRTEYMLAFIENAQQI